jgi:hypothetical protein
MSGYCILSGQPAERKLSMDDMQLNRVMRRHAYSSQSIAITPDPPQVGVATTITIHLKNPGAEAVTVSCIETMIAQFGMGITWEQLPVLGPFHLPADPDHVEEISMEWTPKLGGHRCLRANIHIETLPTPLRIGRNLQVIESEADCARWQIPFRLGNPEAVRAPVALEVGGENLAGMMAHLIVDRRMIQPGEQIWLNPGEKVDARLLVRARTPDAIASVHTIEAFINGRFLDGIQVEIHRPALVARVSEQREFVADEPLVMIH